MIAKMRTKTRTVASSSFQMSENMSFLLFIESSISSVCFSGAPLKDNLAKLQLNFVTVAIICIDYDSCIH